LNIFLWREDITYFVKLANGNREIRKTAGDPIRTPTGMKIVGSPAGYIMSYALEEYNFI
jgi:hypothetical protein